MNRRINKYELEEELKKALHNRKQEDSRFFFYDDFLSIEYDVNSDWVYSNWKGYQTESSIQEGYRKLHDALKTFRCSKILNDNTNVLGMWTSVSTWMDTSWLPMMRQAGLKYFAWVYPRSLISRESRNESIRSNNIDNVVQIFEDIETARQWLESK